jgi:hypothetical protein
MPTFPRRNALALLLALAAGGASAQEPFMQIRLTVDGRSATATLYDNATARDFAALLPLTLTMGELTHYVPWGNLAIFIEGRSYSRGLLPLGKVHEGLPVLARPGPYPLRIEVVLPKK